jgi:RNA polymerase sigma factor (TIGR02999 family)
MSEFTRILQGAERGEANSSSQLLTLLYGELRRIAAFKMANEGGAQTLQPTALVHEAWLRLAGSDREAWKNRGQFLAAAAEAMRRILIERARRRARLRHGGGHQRVSFEAAEAEVAGPASDEKVLLINEALARLEHENPDRARVVVLKFFGGLTNQEVAESLGVTERTVERHWSLAKAWLFDSIRKGM